MYVDSISRATAMCAKTLTVANSSNMHQEVYLLAHKKSHNPHECEECHKKFTTEISLKLHLQRFHTGKTFKCSTCGRTFSQKSSVKNHERVHAGGSLFRCEVCSMTFTRKSYLAQHSKTVHVRERKWKCSTCGRAFEHNTLLRRHERVHTGERPYECDVCMRRFTRQDHLSEHRARAHSGKQEAAVTSTL